MCSCCQLAARCRWWPTGNNCSRVWSLVVVGLYLSVFMPSLRSALINLFCCCCCCKRRDVDTEVSSVSQPASSVTAAVRLASFHTAVTTIPTRTDIQEPHQRRSSLSLYAKRCETPKSYHSSSDSMKTDCSSPTKRSVVEATAFMQALARRRAPAFQTVLLFSIID